MQRGSLREFRKNWLRLVRRYRWRLGPSPGGINESLSVELSGAWEPLSNWRACRYSASARSHDRVCVGNMVGSRSYGMGSLSVEV